MTVQELLEELNREDPALDIMTNNKHTIKSVSVMYEEDTGISHVILNIEEE